MATKEAIEKLKESWRADPCWDIEETEGFEEHKEELLAFRKEQENEFEKRDSERKKERALQMRRETGIAEPNVAMYLRTFAEIEIQIQSIPTGLATMDEITVECAQAQVSATLLLAAQVKRVADALETQFLERDAKEYQSEVRELYRVPL